MKINEKFKHIYLLTLSSRQDRFDAMCKQFEYMEILISDITVHYATPFPHNNIIADAFNKSGKGRFTKANEFDCSRNHYGIVREAYDRGFENVLIIEDDLQFINNKQLWEDALNTVPDDFDIIQYGGFSADPRIKKYLTNSNVSYVKHPDVGMWNCSMYALSRKGMEYYLAFMDKIFWVADGPLYKAPLNDKIINTYMTSIPMVIQADKKHVSSDIRNEKNDNIDYNNENLYESMINKADYFPY